MGQFIFGMLVGAFLLGAGAYIWNFVIKAQKKDELLAKEVGGEFEEGLRFKKK